MKPRIPFLATLLTLALVSCSDNNKLETIVDGTTTAKQEELTWYSTTYSNVINYKVARYLAYQELVNGVDQLEKLPAEYELSEFPNVIYDYDNIPKYYEYEAIVNGEVVATITTYAQKEDDCVIAYIFSGKRTTRKIGMRAFVGKYPAVYYGVKQTPGSITQSFTDAENKNVTIDHIAGFSPQNIDPWSEYYAMTEEMDEENRQATLATIEEMKQSPEYLELVENEAKVDEYWKELECLTNGITTMSDKDINRLLIQNSSISLARSSKKTGDKDDKDPNGITGSPTKYYIISTYNNDNLKRTSWCTYCGPGAIAWVFRGLYDSYPISGQKKKYIEINPLSKQSYNDANGTVQTYSYHNRYGNYSYYYCLDDTELYRIYTKEHNNLSQQLDNGFLEEIYSHTVKMGNDYPMFQLGITNAIKNLTDGQYGVQSTTTSHQHINNKHLPILICYVPKGGDGASHYVVGFGSGKIGTKKYVYVTDNTNKIQDFGFKAYWRKETTGNYGLRYKIVKK